jgi:integrase
MESLNEIGLQPLQGSADKPLRSRDQTISPKLDRLAEHARDFAAARAADNTRRAYGFDWGVFQRWCDKKGLDPSVPSPEVVGLFLTAMATGDGLKKAAASTIERRLSALTTTYRSLGTPLDRDDRHVVDVLAGIKRKIGQPPVKKQALYSEDVIAMLGFLPQTLRGLRDRAIILIGFAGGLRRSEIVGLDCGPQQTEDGSGWTEFSAEGLLLTIRGKTGWRIVEIARGSRPQTCPVQALETWLSFAKIQNGSVFRRVRERNCNVGPDRLHHEQVARIVRASALRAGVKGDWPEDRRRQAFAGHSLRSGFASSAIVDEAQIQRQLGHSSVEMTRRYRQERQRFRINLTKAVGL